MRKLLALAAIVLLGCDGEPTIAKKNDAPAVISSTKRYPETGRVKKFELTIREHDWEVAPGAIYKAITYNGTIPGPVLEVDAGDRVEVTLINETKEPHSAHTHIVEFDEANDGVHKGIAPPGGRVTVVWKAVFAGTFPYHDHAGGHGGEVEGISAGLVGALVVHPTDLPKPDKMNVVVLTDFDLGRYKSLPGVGIGDAAPADGEYRGGHQYLHTINGRAYEEWAPKFEAKVGQRVRWGVVSLGKEFHTFHVHGHRWIGANGVLTDNITLGPGTYATFEWIEDNPGTWLYHCHVPEHMEGGMMGHYVVRH